MINHEKIKKNSFQEKLRSCFFEIISNVDVDVYSYEHLIKRLTETMSDLFDASFVGIYVSNQRDRTYQFICHNLNQIPNYFRDINPYVHLLQEYFIDHTCIKSDKIFGDYTIARNSILLKLDFANQPNYLLLECNNNYLSIDLIKLLQTETNLFMQKVDEWYNVKDRNRKKEFLLKLSKDLYSSIDMTEILKKLIASLQKLYPTFSFNLLLSHDFDRNIGLPIQSIEYSDNDTKQLSTKAYTTGEVQIEDNKNERNLYAPLQGSQGVYGVIQIVTQTKIFFSDEEIEFFSKFARMAGRAIENATLYQHSIHLVSDLKLINDITHKLNSNLKFTQLIKIVRNEIINICKASQVGFIYYYHGLENDFDILEGSTPFFNTSQGYMFVKYLAGQMKQKKEPLFSGNYTKNYVDLPFKSVISIPMIASGQIHGFIVMMHEESSFFTFENFKLMQSLINHSTLALTNAVLREKLEHAVITDYLTKLYSRSHLDKMLKKHMLTDKKGTLILLDIDDFKNINDTYGHYVGDEVIVQIAEIIMENIDEKDIPTRWGGEEFAIYLPEKSLLEGVQLVETIRNQVIHETDPQVTFSCGISTWNMNKVNSVSDIFIRADKALYEAKSMGKNCIVTEECMK